MKKVISILVLFFIFVSCEEQGALTKDKVDDPIEVPTTGLKYSGPFVSAPGESVSGFAKIYLENERQLALENLNTSGPDLKVYLSKTDKPDEFVNLGSFSNSKINYAIPTGIDVSVYKYVIIYCQQYSVIFGVATLTQS